MLNLQNIIFYYNGFINCIISFFFFSEEATLRYATCTETDFENIVAEWLCFATQRNKRDRVKENVDEENIDDKNLT